MESSHRGRSFQQEPAEPVYFLYDDRWFPPVESGQRAYRIYVEKNSLVNANRH